MEQKRLNPKKNKEARRKRNPICFSFIEGQPNRHDRRRLEKLEDMKLKIDAKKAFNKARKAERKLKEKNDKGTNRKVPKKELAKQG